MSEGLKLHSASSEAIAKLVGLRDGLIDGIPLVGQQYVLPNGNMLTFSHCSQSLGRDMQERGIRQLDLWSFYPSNGDPHAGLNVMLDQDGNVRMWHDEHGVKALKELGYPTLDDFLVALAELKLSDEALGSIRSSLGSDLAETIENARRALKV